MQVGVTNGTGGSAAGGNSGGTAAGVSGAGAPGAGASAAIAGGGGTGGAPTPSGGQPAAGGGMGSGATAAPDWQSGLNDDFKGFVQTKGWKDPTQVVESYRNLEKLVGVAPDQIIRMAKEDDTAGWDSIYTRLGRPANPEGYGLEVPKEGGSADFVKWASTEFHKAGLSQKQGKQMVEAWNNYINAQKGTQKEAYSAKITEDQTALKKEWGAAYDQNMSIAKRAAREFGVDPKVVDSIEATAGFAGTMKFFNAIGSKLGDARFVAGGNSNDGSSGPLTPEQARHQINSLRMDPGFTAKYVSGDSGARQKMESLHKFAYPDG